MRLRLGNKGFSHLLLIIILLVIAALVGAGLRVANKSKNGTANSVLQVASGAPKCEDANLLKNSPVKPDQISTIIPLGNLAPPGHITPTTHMYYNLIHQTSNGVKIPNRTELYVPADMIVTKIMKSDNADLKIPYVSYKVDFTICEEVAGYFILIQELNAELEAAIQPPFDRTDSSDVGSANNSTNYTNDVRVELKAGEILGYIGGREGDPTGVDFTLQDSRAPKPVLANPDLWNSNEQYFVCTLDYYSKDLKDQLYAKIGDFSLNLRSPGEPICGDVYQDIPGTAQGVWRTSDAKGAWDVRKVIALVRNNFDNSERVLSLGNIVKDIGIDSSRTKYFKPSVTGLINTDFKLVKSNGQIHCYDLDDRSGQSNSKTSVLIQYNGSKLRLGPKTGNCSQQPWSFDKYIDFVR